MEDKLRHLTDDAFTDHAWGEMKNLLDEEMPVGEKRKKRFAWWWTVLLLGLLSGAAAYGWVSQKEAPVTEPKQAPVAAFDTNDKLLEGTKNQATTRAETEVKPTPKTNSSKVKKQVSTKPAISSSKIKNTAQVADKQPFTTKENILPLPTPAPSIRGENVAVEPFSTNETNILSENKPELLPPPLESMLVDRIPGHPLTELGIPFKSPSVNAKACPRKKFGLSAYTSTAFSPKNNGSGIGAGLLVDFPIQNSRFNVQAGLGYAYLRQPLSFVFIDGNSVLTPSGGIDTTDESSLADLDGGSYVAFDESKLSPVNASSERVPNVWNDNLDMHFLQLPVEVNYQRGRWRGLVGAEAGILLTSQSEFFSGGIFSEDRILSEANAINSSSVSSSKISNFDFAATAGIGFDISPRFGVDVKYRVGWADMIKDNGETKDFNRFLQATFRYRIR